MVVDLMPLPTVLSVEPAGANSEVDLLTIETKVSPFSTDSAEADSGMMNRIVVELNIYFGRASENL